MDMFADPDPSYVLKDTVGEMYFCKRNYAKALDDPFAFCASRPLSRALLLECWPFPTALR
jgi:hypothetical protein